MYAKPAIALSSVLLIALPVGPALAKGDRAEVRTNGQCSGTAMWKLKAKEDDGGVEVEFEVDSNVVGQAWDYSLSGPGGLIASGTRTTTAPSGSFSVEVQTSGAVTDEFTALATFAGQICDTTVSNPSPGPSPSPSDDNPSDDDANDDSKGGKGSGDDSTRTEDRQEGSCTDDSAVATLRIKGRKAMLTVDTDSRGDAWRYEIRRDGKVVKKGVARTKGSKAKFTVKAKVKSSGTYTASATKVGSDDSCEIAS